MVQVTLRERCRGSRVPVKLQGATRVSLGRRQGQSCAAPGGGQLICGDTKKSHKSADLPNRGTPAIRGAGQESNSGQFLSESHSVKDGSEVTHIHHARHTFPPPTTLRRPRASRSAPPRSAGPCPAHIATTVLRTQRSRAAQSPGEISIRTGVRTIRTGRHRPAPSHSRLPARGTAVCRLRLRGAGHVEPSGRHGVISMPARRVRAGHARLNKASTTHPCGCVRPVGAVPVSA